VGLRVAVIGAGAAGMAALRELKEAGLGVTCFEKGERVGGIWAYGNCSGLSPAYETLHLNTSRARTEYRDYPMPADWPDFPSHEMIQRYFEAYVDHFGLRDSIRFECGVAHAEPLDGGGWRLDLENGESEEFDALVVANGHNWDPRWPDPPYPGEFGGEQIHAHDFRSNTIFEGKRVLVVGIGNSAMDIAVESSLVAERTLISTRRGAWIVPKNLLGKPADQIVRPAMTRLHWRLRQPITQTLLRATVGRPERFGLPAPTQGFLQDHPTISDTLLSRITHGEIEPRPGIARLDGDCIEFTDGRRDLVDAIVWCTGYRISFPFFDPDLVSAPGGDLPLYKRIFHPDLPSVFFVGLIQSTGSAIPICEQQSKLVAAHLTGRYAPPPRERQLADIERTRAKNEKRYGAGKRPTMRVDFDGFMRELPRELARGEKRARRTGFVPHLAARGSRAPDSSEARRERQDADRGAPTGSGRL